ncbi:MAG TPA: hypothetical protein VHV32_19285 [Candidatus Angelobacter sp.]|jgi:hypothetical protein|nr:hypothetical protein [Candidatus Angelobacter sp.]
MSAGRYVGKDVFGNKVFMASTSRVAAQRENCDRLLLIIGDYMGWGGDISHVFISDRSTFGDFNLEDSQLKAISQKIGLAVAQADYLHEVALRMGPTQ